MKYKYLLFDLDGTLTNPFEGITKCVQYALSECGVRVDDLNELRCFIGPPLVPAFMKFYGFSEEQAYFALEKYRERFTDRGWCENEIFDGIPELLNDLKKHGYIIALATSKPEQFANRILEYFDIKKYFDEVVGATLDESRNEKADIISEIFRRMSLGNSKEKILMIGDRKHDIIGAKLNCISSLGVRFGFAEEGELEAAGADYICDNIDSMRDFLLK